MNWLDLTMPTPAANLALDEALLAFQEQEPLDPGTLRFWESPSPFVVIGYGQKRSQVVNVTACEQRGIPILRRCSGGGTVVQGPGCLNYTLILRLDALGNNPSIPAANHAIMQRNAACLSRLTRSKVRVEGHTDLVIGQRKVSGNAQRRARTSLLFHGTFLLHFDLDLIASILPEPSQQPDYRRNRPHSAFLTNLHLPASDVKAVLRDGWKAESPFKVDLSDDVDRLVAEKYSQESWNAKR